MTNIIYQVGGSLSTNAPTYARREADDQLYQALRNGEFCYVLNSRQMGKSSLLVHTLHRLQEEGFLCSTIDMTRIGSENITPLQWYKGIVGDLWRGFNLLGQVNLKKWWQEQEEISLLQRLSQFIEEILLVRFPQERIFIFIDEIDSILSLGFPVDDFFALIRYCYNQRSINPEYNRITFAIFGVATPSDLIMDKNRTPFNIGVAIDLHGFNLTESQPLAKGLESVITNPQAILKEILTWTGGQPFLTQKLCALVVRMAGAASGGNLMIPPGTEGFFIESVVREKIIDKWESQDEPEHLKTIKDRLLRKQCAGRLLGIYQQILQALQLDIYTLKDKNLESDFLGEVKSISTDDSPEQIELLLSGLVVRNNGYLQVRNRIYAEVFNLDWVEKQLEQLRPYSQTFTAWIASQQTDNSRLLRGKALQDAQSWAQEKSLSNLDYQFLAASAELDRQEVQLALEADRTKEVEARLAEQQRRLIQEKQAAKRQRVLLLAVSSALVLASILGVSSYAQYRKAQNSELGARISEIKALVSSAEGLFASHQRLDALLEGIKAQERLEQLSKVGKVAEQLRAEVTNTLQLVVYDNDEYNRLSGHQTAVMTVQVSPDSQLIVSAGVDKTIKLWRRDGTEIRTFFGHRSMIRDVKFSPDGQTIASASDDGTLKLWRLDGTLLGSIDTSTTGLWEVAFSPDGQTIASASMDSTVKLWRRDGTLLRTFSGHLGGAAAVAFSPDGQTIVSAGGDRTIKLWQLDGTLLQTLEGHSSVIAAVTFSPDGKFIVSGSGDQTIKIWRQDGSLVQTLRGHGGVVVALAFSPDGQRFASASRDKTVKIWRIDGTELITLRGHTAAIWGMDWSPDGDFIASAGGDSVVRLWQSQNPFKTAITAHQAGIWAIALSQDSQTIVTGSEDNTVKLWNQQGKLLKTFPRGQAAIYGVAINDNPPLVATAQNDGSINLWDQEGNLLTTNPGHEATIFSIVFSPDGQTIASGSQDNTVKLWRRDGTLLHTLKGHNAPIWQVAFSPDGQTIASAGGDGTVKLWGLDGTLRNTLKGHSASVWRLAFSPDGQLLATGSGDSQVNIWTKNGQLLRTLTHPTAVWGLAFSPNSQLIAIGGTEGVMKLWQVSGQELTTLRGHTASIRGLAYSRDGKFVATVSEDNTLVLWNIQQFLNLDLSDYGCDRVRDYLRTNAKVLPEDKSLCDRSQ